MLELLQYLIIYSVKGFIIYHGTGTETEMEMDGAKKMARKKLR